MNLRRPVRVVTPLAVLFLLSPALGADCATCHLREAASFRATPMGKSLTTPQALPDATLTHGKSQSVLSVEQQSGGMVHSISRDGLAAEYQIRYQIGGGLMGASFLVQIGSYLFESPVSWFKRYGWDVSPGYGNAPTIDFDRPIGDTCLFCHAATVEYSDSDGLRLRNSSLHSITCERCHGPGERHGKHPSAKNIVNPGHLSGPARDSVCEQCHLEAAGRILNPRKQWSDFHAGEPAEQTFATYMFIAKDKREINAVSQVEELAQSQCARMSGGKLWCGTCHNPHPRKIADRPSEIRAICTSCHRKLSRKSHPAAQTECTSCHMPRNPTTNVAHAALTDHRILRRPLEQPSGEDTQPQKLTSWREPPSAFRVRDLALGEVLAGASKSLPAIEEDGARLLRELPSELQQDDFDVLSALEGLYLQRGDLDQAIRAGRHTVELKPQSARAAMNYGMVLERSGDLADAERAFNRAVELNPSLKSAYAELAKLYSRQGRTSEMNHTLDRYLGWNPQDIMFRLQKERMSSEH